MNALAKRELVGRATRPLPDIPRAKREGLDLDLAAIATAGPSALTPDDHYRLKTYGVCAQRHTDLFMVRLRVPGGRLDRGQVATIADGARRFAHGFLHLTARQNVELHSVRLEDVPGLYELLEPAGVVGRSSCGHTVRNVIACSGAAASLDEPFDTSVDARFLSKLLVERSRQLNTALPSRLNVSLGGCAACAAEALTNDIGLVATVVGGDLGYQLWAGGSLGSSPRLSVLLRPYLPRRHLWPAVWSVIDWFLSEGDIEDVAKGRLKFVIEAKGEAAFRAGVAKRFDDLAASDVPVPPVSLPAPARREEAFAEAPLGGWRDGVAPERRPGLASVTVRVPLGDLLADELEHIAELAPWEDVVLTRDQNVVLPSVPVGDVPKLTARLAEIGLGPDGVRSALDVRACPGLAFCSLAITASQLVALSIEAALQERPDLRDASVAVSGCPNSCTKHQAADVGFAGAKVKVGNQVGLGYQMFLGSDLPAGLVGEPVLRVLEEEVPRAATAALEIWKAARRPGEPPGPTYRRLGLATVAGAIALRLRPADTTALSA
jgi:sulfite reductase beta subunit-like hemoprotein